MEAIIKDLRKGLDSMKKSNSEKITELDLPKAVLLINLLKKAGNVKSVKDLKKKWYKDFDTLSLEEMNLFLNIEFEFMLESTINYLEKHAETN